MTGTFDADRVRHVAALARLRLTPAEEEAFARELASIASAFATLPAGAGEAASPLAPASLRADEAVPAEEDVRERIVDAFPRREGRLARVPRGL